MIAQKIPAGQVADSSFERVQQRTVEQFADTSWQKLQIPAVQVVDLSFEKAQQHTFEQFTDTCQEQVIVQQIPRSSAAY